MSNKPPKKPNPYADNPYPIGKGKPPNNQYAPGQSGNLKRGPNRVPKTLNKALTRLVRTRKVSIRADGERKVISLVEAVAERIANDALGGKDSAIDRIERLDSKGTNAVQLERDNKHLQKELAEVKAELEKLKDRPSGVLALPGIPVNTLESRMLYEPPEELVPYIMEHLDELEDMIRRKNILVRSSDVK